MSSTASPEISPSVPLAEPVPIVSTAEESSKIVAPYDLSKFELDSILSNATNRKMITCLGRFLDRSETDQAIVLFEKNPFDERHVRTTKAAEAREVVVVDCGGSDDSNESTAEPGYFSSHSTLKERFTNDIYGTFECFPNPAVNSNTF